MPEPFHLSLNDEPLFIFTSLLLTSTDKFSLLLTPHYPHHPSSNCQFRFIYTKLTADTISRSLNLWEGLGSASAVACVFKLLTRVQPCFFVLPVLGFDSRQYHERWLSEDERVGGSLGIILIEIFHLECLKTGNCNNDRHGTQLLLIKGFGWSRYIFIWYRTLLQSSQIKKSDGKYEKYLFRVVFHPANKYCKCPWQINSSKERGQYDPIWSHPLTHLLLLKPTLKNAQDWHLMFLSRNSQCFQSFHASTEEGFYPKHSKLQDDNDKIPYFDRGKQNCHFWWLLRVEMLMWVIGQIQNSTQYRLWFPSTSIAKILLYALVP